MVVTDHAWVDRTCSHLGLILGWEKVAQPSTGPRRGRADSVWGPRGELLACPSQDCWRRPQVGISWAGVP